MAIFGAASNEKELQAFRVEEGISWQPDLTAAEAVLIFGGDGTVHRYLSQLVNLQLPLLVVPRGSGNDFARALGIHSRQDALAAWRRFVGSRDNIRTLDLGSIASIEEAGSPTRSETYFCTLAGIGLDGEVLRRVNRLPRWFRGNGGYALTLLPALFRFAALPVKISQAGATNYQKENGFDSTFLAAFANTPAYGGGMKIAPKARLDDGLLDICIIRNINKLKLLSVFPSVYFGRHLGISGVEYAKARAARVETREPLDVYADGEYVCRTPVDISIKRAALRVIAP
jgi:diacylglycerol kinase (ATP)